MATIDKDGNVSVNLSWKTESARHSTSCYVKSGCLMDAVRCVMNDAGIAVGTGGLTITHVSADWLEEEECPF